MSDNVCSQLTPTPASSGFEAIDNKAYIVETSSQHFDIQEELLWCRPSTEI